jgi:hypothetical protein
MTCDTARTLLLFYRPGASDDLAAEDLAALETHLKICSACNSIAKRQIQEDAAIGRAVHNVPIPAGLRERLHAHVAAEASRLWRQTWAMRGVAAAAIIVAALTGWGVHFATRPSLDTVRLALNTEEAFGNPEATLRNWFATEGIPSSLPEDLDFGQLTFYGYAGLQGERVPVLELRNQTGFARIYVLRPRQFKVKDAPEAQSSLVTVRLYRDSPAVGWTVVIVHPTGVGLRPFLRVPRPAA